MLAVGEAGSAEGTLGVDTTEKKFYDVTASGTFNKDNFRLKSSGIEATPAGTGRVSTLAMSDLQVEETPMGGGASGMVRRALHVPTQKHIALKSINVSDKSKCDQVSPPPHAHSTHHRDKLVHQIFSASGQRGGYNTRAGYERRDFATCEALSIFTIPR